MEEQKAEEDRRQEEEELKKKKKEEEKEEGLRLLHAREKAEEEETRISKALKAKKEEYKVHAEARRVEAQKDKEEKDRLWARYVIRRRSGESGRGSMIRSFRYFPVHSWQDSRRLFRLEFFSFCMKLSTKQHAGYPLC